MHEVARLASLEASEQRLLRTRIADRDAVILHQTAQLARAEADIEGLRALCLSQQQQLQLQGRRAAAEVRTATRWTSTGSDFLVLGMRTERLAAIEASERWQRHVLRHAAWLAAAAAHWRQLAVAAAGVASWRAVGRRDVAPTTSSDEEDEDGGGISSPQRARSSAVATPPAAVRSGRHRGLCVGDSETARWPRRAAVLAAAAPPQFFDDDNDDSDDDEVAAVGELARALARTQLAAATRGAARLALRCERRVAREKRRTGASLAAATQLFQLQRDEMFQRHAVWEACGDHRHTLVARVACGGLDALRRQQLALVMADSRRVLAFAAEETHASHAASVRLLANGAEAALAAVARERACLAICEALQRTAAADGERDAFAALSGAAFAAGASEATLRQWQREADMRQRDASLSLRHRDEPIARGDIGAAEAAARLALADASEAFLRSSRAHADAAHFAARANFAASALHVTAATHAIAIDAAASLVELVAGRGGLLPATAALCRDAQSRAWRLARRQREAEAEAAAELRHIEAECGRDQQRLLLGAAAGHAAVAARDAERAALRRSLVALERAAALEKGLAAATAADGARALAAFADDAARRIAAAESRAVRDAAAQLALASSEQCARASLVEREAGRRESQLLLPLHGLAVERRVDGERAALVDSVEAEARAVLAHARLGAERHNAAAVELLLLPAHRRVAQTLLGAHKDFFTEFLGFLRQDVTLSERRWQQRAHVDAGRHVQSAMRSCLAAHEEARTEAHTLHAALARDVAAACALREARARGWVVDFVSGPAWAFLGARLADLHAHGVAVTAATTALRLEERRCAERATAIAERRLRSAAADDALLLAEMNAALRERAAHSARLRDEESVAFVALVFAFHRAQLAAAVVGPRSRLPAVTPPSPSPSRGSSQMRGFAPSHRPLLAPALTPPRIAAATATASRRLRLASADVDGGRRPSDDDEDDAVAGAAAASSWSAGADGRDDDAESSRSGGNGGNGFSSPSPATQRLLRLLHEQQMRSELARL